MSNLRINKEEIIGDLIPNAYVQKVVLESGGDVIDQRNPHANPGSPDRDPVTGEVLIEQSQSDSSSDLEVTVDVLLKDTVEDNVISSWFEQQDFHKFLKIRVITTTSEFISRVIFRADTKGVHRERVAATQTENYKATIAHLISAEGFPSDDFEERMSHVEKHLFYKSFGTRLQHDLGLYEEEQDQDGNIIRNINFRTSFTIPGNVNPKHLNVFAFTYLDVEALAEEIGEVDFGFESGLRLATGRLVAQAVIENSRMIREAVIFRDEDGKIWPGPVHQMSSGVWMGGRFHDPLWEATDRSDVQPILERVVIPNTTVQDFRNVAEIDKRVIDFSFFENRTFPTFNKIFREREKDNLQSNPTAYFSDLWLTRGVDDDARMIFSFNAGKFIKENTKYPLLLEQRPGLVSEYYLIKSLKVVRKRVKKPIKFKDEVIGLDVNPEDIIDFDKNAIAQTIIDVEETTPGRLPQQASEQTGNSIREIRVGNEGLVRTFTASDKQIIGDTDGFYQYGIEMEIHDNLNQYLNEQLTTLMNNRDELNAYFTEAVQPTGRFSDGLEPTTNPHIIFNNGNNSPPLQRQDQKGNYDPQTNRFTQSFIEMVDRRYADNPAEKPWIKTVAKLSDLLFFFASGDSGRAGLQGTNFRRDLWTMCSPKTGSPDGILTVLKLINNIVTELQRLLGVTTSLTSGTSAGATTVNSLNTLSSGVSSSKPKKDVYKLQHWFDNSIFDSNELKQTGFHYLLDKSEQIDLVSGNGGFAGARTIRSQKFTGRVSRETLRYFTQENPALPTQEFSVDPELMSSLTQTSVSDYTFLAPSAIRTASSQMITLFDDVIDPQGIAASVSEILNIKSPPNEPKRIPSPRSRDKKEPEEERSSISARVVRDNLTDVLADRGCTVELPLRAPSQARVQLQTTVQGTVPRTQQAIELRGLPSVGGILTPEDIRDAAGASASGVGDYLTTNSSIVNQFGVGLENTVDITTPKDEDILNSGALFLRILFNAMLKNEGLLRTQRILNFQGIRRKLSIDNFDLANTNNAIEIAKRPTLPGLNSRTYSSFVSKLPNQIKSLFLASNLTGQAVVKNPVDFQNKDVLRDPITAIPIFLRHLNLMQIEVLTGFRDVQQSVQTLSATAGASDQRNEQPNTRQKIETQLKNPMWEPLTRENFQRLVDQQREMICRLKPFINSKMDVEAVAGLQLSVYDRYFVIRPDQTRDLPAPSVNTENSSINSLVNLEETLRVTRGEYVSTDPRVLVETSQPITIDAGATTARPRTQLRTETIYGRGQRN